MPNNIVMSFADKTGKSEEEVEKIWNKAKILVKKQYDISDEDEKFFKLVTGVVKKVLKIKEEEFSTAAPTSTATGQYAPKIGTVKKRKKKRIE